MWFGTVHLRQTQFRPLHKERPSPRNREVDVHLEPTPSFWQPNQGSGRRERGLTHLWAVQGTGKRPSVHTRPPSGKDSKMQRKRTGPGAPRAGPSPRKRESVDA